MFIFALFAVIGLASCGSKEVEYKLGMGVVVSTSSSANATAEKAGTAQIDATVAAVVLDAEGKIVVTERELKIDPLGHDMKEIAGKSATCTQDGVNPHYQCKTCKVLFSDVKGQNVLTSSEIVI